jgi:uncharacterized membrane-anchored protein YjiN (DUF445 family)
MAPPGVGRRLTAAADPSRRLRRMRLAAGGLLAAMAGLYAVATALEGRAGWISFVRAFAEAATVGACADWFAVTALFRRPFGLPIPHTAIIPRNKDRIGQALGGFIVNNFLTAEVLEPRLRQLEVGRWGAAWLRQPRNASPLAARLVRLIPELLDMSTAEARRQFVGGVVAEAMRSAPAARVAAAALRAVTSGERGDAVLDALLALAASALAANQDLFRAEVAGRTYRWLPRWIDEKIADKILDALSGALEAMGDHAHPARERIRSYVEDFIARLETDPALAARAEALKRQLLEHPTLGARLGEFGDALEASLRPASEEEARRLADRMAAVITGFGAWLYEQSDAIAIFNAWVRQAAQRLIVPRRREIGRLIAKVVATWDVRTVVDKLELQVGADLQYIRINGTLVGGLVGLGIFTVSRWLGARP